VSGWLTIVNMTTVRLISIAADANVVLCVPVVMTPRGASMYTMCAGRRGDDPTLADTWKVPDACHVKQYVMFSVRR
jgi:hypothetical protein